MGRDLPKQSKIPGGEWPGLRAHSSAWGPAPPPPLEPGPGVALGGQASPPAGCPCGRRPGAWGPPGAGAADGGWRCRPGSQPLRGGVRAGRWPENQGGGQSGCKTGSKVLPTAFGSRPAPPAHFPGTRGLPPASPTPAAPTGRPHLLAVRRPLHEPGLLAGPIRSPGSTTRKESRFPGAGARRRQRSASGLDFLLLITFPRGSHRLKL